MQKKHYRLVALDMDGTLLGSDHQVSDYTRNVLAQADRAGKTVALATGRCLSELTEFIDSIPAIRYVICENGANVYDTRQGKSVHRVSFSHEQVEFAMTELAKTRAIAQFFMGDQSYLRCAREIDLVPYRLDHFRSVFDAGSIYAPDLFERYRATRQPVDKIDVYFSSEVEREQFRLAMQELPVEIVGSIGIGLEVSPLHANKADGFLKLCEFLNIPAEDAIAVGDADNDRGILAAAGLSVAMGNAIPEVIAMCDEITDDCDHHGAAKAIEKFMLV